jgi:hypothetical protein
MTESIIAKRLSGIPPGPVSSIHRLREVMPSTKQARRPSLRVVAGTEYAAVLKRHMAKSDVPLSKFESSTKTEGQDPHCA